MKQEKEKLNKNFRVLFIKRKKEMLQKQILKDLKILCINTEINKKIMQIILKESIKILMNFNLKIMI